MEAVIVVTFFELNENRRNDSHILRCTDVVIPNDHSW